TRSKRDWSSDVCSSDLFEHGPLVADDRGLNGGCCCDGMGEFDAVEHGEIDSMAAEGAHHVSRVAKQRDAGVVVPAERSGKCVDRTAHVGAVVIGHEGQHPLCPAIERAEQEASYRWCVVEVDACLEVPLEFDA